jgi:hypothetical protein
MSSTEATDAAAIGRLRAVAPDPNAKLASCPLATWSSPNSFMICWDSDGAPLKWRAPRSSVAAPRPPSRLDTPTVSSHRHAAARTGPGPYRSQGSVRDTDGTSRSLPEVKASPDGN